jgi:hypothetical protein
VRLAQKLVKTILVLAVSAAALGGAAALGSTLFDAPPRDAAEFSKWIDAGSVHLDATTESPATPVKAVSKRAKKAAAAKELARTPAEARYVRALSRSCRRQLDDVRALGRPRTFSELETYLEQALALIDRYHEISGPRTPHRYRHEAARITLLNERTRSLVEHALVAARQEDADTVLVLSEKLMLVGARESDIARRIGALACVYTPYLQTY